MWSYINQNLVQLLVVGGLLILVIEIIILGLSTFILFVIGTSAILTGLVIAMGLIPAELSYATVSFLVTSCMVWLISRPLFQYMKNEFNPVNGNKELIGHRFTLPEDLTIGQSITLHYLGTDWQVSAREAIFLGLEVEIIKVMAGKLTVRKVQ